MRFLHSNSAHEAFDTCRAKFRLMQENAPRGGDADNLRFGITFHLFAEKYVSHCVTARRWSDIELVPTFVREAFEQSQLSTKYFEEMRLLCEQFARCYPIDPDRSIERERGVAFDESLQPVEWTDDLEYDSPSFRRGDSTAMYRTKHDHVLLDARELRLTVVNYKTDRHVPSQSEIDDPSSRFWKQARNEAWSARRRFFPRATEVVHEFVFARYTTKQGHLVMRRSVFTAEELDVYELMFLERIALIESTTEFPAISGEHCRECPFRTTGCPLRGDFLITEPEQIALRYLYDEVEQDERREALKIMAEDGSITVGELQLLLFETTERHVLDVAKVVDALRAEGIEEPAYLLDISLTKLKQLLDADQLERVLAAASTPETAVIFNVHQRKEQLVELAKTLGIDPGKKTVKQLALEIARTPKKAA